VSLVHDDAHVVPLHTYGEHITVGLVQLPPTQTWFVCVATEHVGAAHAVLSGTLHVPSPAHRLPLQLATFATQTLCGSCPAGTFAHIPPPKLHALQPLHIDCGTLQHVASTQFPDWQLLFAPHVVPRICFGAQRPVPLQKLMFPQSPCTLQSFPSAHAAQLPPQSTSLSVPFFTPSLHVAAQCIAVQTPPRQSPLIAHPCW